MGATHQADVPHAVITAKPEGVPMVEFESGALLAASSLLVHVAASVSVALTHGTLDGGGNVALRPPQATRLESFELLGDGLLDDRRQVAVPSL